VHYPLIEQKKVNNINLHTRNPNKLKLQALLDYTQCSNGSSQLDCQIMFRFIRKRRYKYILELGVSHGHSTVPLLVGAYLNQGHLYSCDIKNIHLLDTWLSKFDCQFLKEYWNFYLCDSLNLKIKGNFDMVFLDTSHVHQQTVQELELFSKATNNIFCHDYGINGVRLPILEFVKKHPEWHLKIYNTQCGLAHLRRR